jgi:hypothetical protein
MTIEELLEQHSVPFRRHGEHHHTTEHFINIDCPWCSPTTNRFRLGIHRDQLYCSCWTCGPHPIADVLAEIVGLTKQEVYKLRSIVGHIREKQFPKDRKLLIPVGVEGLQPAHKQYLIKRGFDPEEIVRLWKVQGLGIAAQLQWRLFVPIYYCGTMVSWTTRSIATNSQKRYVSAAPNQEKMSHKTLLYGVDFTRHSCVVHEGPLDVWSTGPGAVCTFGTVYTLQQIEKIAKYPVRAICFDNEPTAQMAARNLCRSLKNYPGETTNVVLNAKDSAEAKRSEIKSLRRRFLE